MLLGVAALPPRVDKLELGETGPDETAVAEDPILYEGEDVSDFGLEDAEEVGWNVAKWGAGDAKSENQEWQRSSTAVGRSLKSLRKHFISRSLASGEMKSGIWGGSFEEAMWNMAAAGVVKLLKGGFPVNISIMVQPTLHISACRP